MGRFEGEVVLVTGGGRGIGAACARAFAAEGARVAVASRSRGELDAVVAEIAAAGHGEALAVSADMAEPASITALFETVAARLGPVDVLVAAAAMIEPKPIEAVDVAGFDRVMAVNVRGVYLCAQQAFAQMQGRGGAIVTFSSLGGLRGTEKFPGMSVYGASKAAVVALTESLAVEGRPQGIRVNCVAPGAIETEGWAVYSEQARSRYPRTNPMMRAGSPWEIAEACVFLGGPGGSFINGETLVVDGGGQHWGEVWTTGKPEYYAAATRVWDDGGTTQGG